MSKRKKIMGYFRKITPEMLDEKMEYGLAQDELELKEKEKREEKRRRKRKKDIEEFNKSTPDIEGILKRLKKYDRRRGRRRKY